MAEPQNQSSQPQNEPGQAERPPRVARVAVNSLNTVCAHRDLYNIIVLVPGTVDPFNVDDTRRAASYSRSEFEEGENDPNWYWRTTRKKSPLVANLDALQGDYPNLSIFKAHGWTGDNNPHNRTVAGAYLAERLCGANGERAWYRGYRKKHVWFHLIGHSHGGNVINEFTRRAAELADWPRGWKIRSVTYLSTPFFNEMHQVDTTRFHPRAHIVNVRNHYDLTQRTIADFSLEPMGSVLTTMDVPGLLAKLKALAWEDLAAKGKAAFSGGEPQVRGFLEAGLQFSEQVNDILARLSAIIDRLNERTKIKLPKGLKDRPGVVTERQIMSDSLAARAQRELSSIRMHTHGVEHDFARALRTGDYALDLDAALALVAALMRLFALDRETLTGPFWDIVHDLALEQTAAFDDTRSTPLHQLEGTPFAERVTDIEVTHHDGYAGKQELRFAEFITRVEAAEATYAQTRQRRHFLDLLFTLLAQMEDVRELVGQLPEHGEPFEAYRQVLGSRDAGGLQVAQTDDAGRELGSLDYLLQTSHNVSRHHLYPEVESALREALGPRRLCRATR